MLIQLSLKAFYLSPTHITCEYRKDVQEEVSQKKTYLENLDPFLKTPSTFIFYNHIH